MARRFRKKPGVGILALPGVPGIGNDTVVEGDEYAKWCPLLLEEVFDAPAKPAAKKAEASPPPPPEEDDEEDEGEPPNMGWTRPELVEYATELGLEIDRETKAEILAMIEEEEAE